ncbi:interaptin-like isoform X2 [Colias croceus]|uniref:interaptin-like isoform X2 n=1 Tax=Colias crocea TaxID=72248 RepID=UPI001E27A131|nr:interaptin-like isoform X2 [Colias croceus]
MSNKSRIPSPARSHGAVTPRRYKPRKSRSVGSPSCSIGSTRLAPVVKDVMELSPMIGRRSVLNDGTEIIAPGRNSWWKNLDENSREVLDVLQNKEMVDAINVLEDLDVEILSQGTKNYSVDLQHSSDEESIKSIVMPHRKLFAGKENPTQKKFQDIIMKRRETLNSTETQKSRLEWDKDLSITPKSLFKRQEKRPQPVFPAALLSISNNKTITTDKTLPPMQPKNQGRHLFGNRPATKQKNMFVDFIVSDSEEEIPDMQPKIFTLRRQSLQKRRASSISNMNSPTASITDLEMDDWKLLPSSTMMEHQFEDQTTPKNPRRSIISGNNEKQNSTQVTVHEKQQQRDKNDDKLMDIDMEDEADVTLTNKSVKETSKTLNKSKNRSNLSNRVSNKSLTKSKHAESHYNKKTHNKEREDSFRTQLKSVAKDLNKSKNKQNVSKAADTIDGKKASDVRNNVEINDMNEIQQESSDEELENSQLRYEEDEAKSEDVENNSEKAQKQTDKKSGTMNVIDGKSSQNLHKTLQDNNSSKTNKNSSKAELNISKRKNRQSANDSKREGKRKTIEKSTEKHAPVTEAEQELEQNLADIQKNPNNVQGLKENREKEKTQNKKEKAQIEREQEQYEDRKVDEELENSELAQQSGVLEDQESEIVQEQESEVEEQDCEDDQEEQEQSEQEEEEEQQESEEEQEESVDVEEEEQQESEIQEQDSETEQQENEAEQEVEQEEEMSTEQEHDNKDANDEDIIDSQNDDKTDEYHPSVEIANSIHERIITNKNETVKSPESVLNKQSICKMSIIEGRNTSVRKTKSIIPTNLTIRPSLAPTRESIEFSDGNNSSANNTHWDSHRTTRHTMRQTFGKDFTPRKSLRTLVMEKSAKRQTNLNDNEEISKMPQANSTEYPEFESVPEHMEVEDSIEESVHTESNQEEQDHVESNHAESGLAESIQEESQHAESENAESANEVSDHAESEHEVSDHDVSNHLQSTNEVSDRAESDHAVSDDAESDQEMEQEVSDLRHEISDNVISDREVSNHEISKRTRQTTLETYLQKIKLENIEKKRKMEEEIRNSLKMVSQNAHVFKVPLKPAIRRIQKTNNKPKTFVRKPAIPLALLPDEILEDLKYKPPKRYQPKNASWATKRLYKFLETKLEPKYDYKARVRAEKLVDDIYKFTRDMKRFDVAPEHSVDELKHEMARLNIVNTHFEFYEFIKAYMPREVRQKVVPSIVNKIPLPKPNVFAHIIQ